jgi:hypothetical protein
VPENKVISLGKRAVDEEKPFFEQLLQEGARKLLQAAIENSSINTRRNNELVVEINLQRALSRQ